MSFMENHAIRKEDLLKALKEMPDSMKIIPMINAELQDDEYEWMFATSIRFEVGEYCEYEDAIYINREALFDHIQYEMDYAMFDTDEEMNEATEEEYRSCEWIPCIYMYIDV